MKNKVILVAGHSAAGKSTFARKLSQALKIPCFCKDTVKEAMADGFGSDSEMLQKRGSSAAISLMLHILECFLQTEKVCILESNFFPPQNEQIESLLAKYGASCLTFLFDGNMEILWERYENRESERHWVHNFVGQSKDRFINGAIRAGVGDFHVGKTVKVDTTDFNKVNYDELFSVAREFLETCF
jgi:predicted kinase